jgi:hypothetical protein
MEPLMTHTDPKAASPEGAGRPAFDPRRSTEIRRLLVSTVAGTPRARRARLSRPAFALAASAALLFAGGIGAGSVVAYDRLSGSVVAEDAAASAESSATDLYGQSASGFEPRSDSAPATTDAESTSEFTSNSAGDLIPVLTLDGELGYAYPGDLEAARLALLGVTADTDIVVDAVSDIGGVPIYGADGTTVLGYFDPAGLIP